MWPQRGKVLVIIFVSAISVWEGKVAMRDATFDAVCFELLQSICLVPRFGHMYIMSCMEKTEWAPDLVPVYVPPFLKDGAPS